jgi:site-specific DNA-cytosine methylase
VTHARWVQYEKIGWGQSGKSSTVEIRHGHIFCGSGLAACGFNQGDARLGRTEARFECVGGVDVDPLAVEDFGDFAGVPGTVLDLFTRDQYTAFHGREPPRDWREATPEDIRRAFRYLRPHILFLSAPCKGFSGLLSDARAGTAKYQALNALALRGVWLALEAFADDPVELVLFENVPVRGTCNCRGLHAAPYKRASAAGASDRPTF